MVRLPGIMRPCTPAAATLNFKKGSSVQDFRVKTFLTVCKTLNYTRAAEELALTQPAVSQHITYLEREYNAKLFTYHRKKLELTRAGRVLRDALATMAHDDALLHERIAEVAHGAAVQD